MFGLFTLFISPIVVETQYWDTVFVNHIAVNLAIIIILWNTFTTTSHADHSTIIFINIFLEANAISTCLFIFSFSLETAIEVLYSHTSTIGWHTHASPKLNVVSSRKPKVL